MGSDEAPVIITIPTNEYGVLSAVKRHSKDGPFTFVMQLMDGPMVGDRQATAVEIMYRLTYPEAMVAAGIYITRKSLPKITLTDSGQMGFLHTQKLGNIVPLSRKFVLGNIPGHVIKRP